MTSYWGAGWQGDPHPSIRSSCWRFTTYGSPPRGSATPRRDEFVAVGGSWQGGYLEYVDHLHEHFAEPVVIKNGRYAAPLSSGAGAEILSTSVELYRYPDGLAWTADA